MKKVVIGCPVRSREWVMRRWFEHVAVAAKNAGVDIEFVFVIADDDPTRPVIAESACAPYHLIGSGESTERDERRWSPSRYRHMTIMRNWLLAAVRGLDPDYFLSLDSDILIHPDLIKNLIQTAEEGWDAVGGKTWMTASTDCCSYIQFVNSHGFIRPDVTGVVPVDVIMAIKLMTPKALAIDYVFDSDGEDVGISREWTKAGLKIAFDGRVSNRHCMNRLDAVGKPTLDTIDSRCGF